MFWERFYKLCKQNNITPNAVCKIMNLSNATATHWKNGSIPKGDVLCNIADYFSCSIDYLLGRTENSIINKLDSVVCSDDDIVKNMKISIDGMEYRLIPLEKKN